MKRYLLLFVLFFTLFSCQKDEELSKDKTSNLDTSLIFGETTGMSVTPYGQKLSDNFEVDLNQDGMPDVRLINTYWHSLGLGYHFNKSIIPLHSKLVILGDISHDTIFINHSHGITQEPNTIKITDTRTFNCFRTNAEDSIYKILPNNFHIRKCVESAKLELNSSFSNDSLPFEGDSYFTINYTYSPNMDTTYMWEETFSNSCETRLGNNPFYIGFVLEENQRKRLGWIKLIVYSPFDFRLLETAIQK